MPSSSNGTGSGNTLGDGDGAGEDDPKLAAFKELFAQSEAKIGALFGDRGDSTANAKEEDLGNSDFATQEDRVSIPEPTKDATLKKPARTIVEDDYDDYDDEDDEVDADTASPLKSRSTGTAAIPSPKLVKPIALPSRVASDVTRTSPPQDSSKTSEDVRKKLEEDKKAAEGAAKRSFQTLFYTLESDRDAMLEQQKLEESDRQVDAEMSGHGNNNSHGNTTAGGSGQPGTLSSANLGASSLTLKHLIARIDAKRDQVRASDAELRILMSEVRKNRSKWASEEKVGQEELYEAAEKVLSELKAMTEHSTAFLGRVNKREAPDYYNVIKHPMDLGSMTKKLKGIQYKSKQEFVDDLNLIWANCLKYNANPEHFLRKHALYMRKETEKLVPLIPEIVIRDRAEVEAEERRLQNGDGEMDGGEESDDEPIMSSRGRKAPGKKAKKGANTARKAPSAGLEGTPGAEIKPSLQSLVSGGSNTNLKNEFLRADSDAPMEGSQISLSTPPPGSITPAGVSGILDSAPPGSQADAMDIDGFGSSVINLTLAQGLVGQGEEIEHDDLEYKTWKQVTKRDRALVAAERNRLFKGDRLNPDEPALLRSKAGMRRWLRKQREAGLETSFGETRAGAAVNEDEEVAQSGETLAEGMEGEDQRVLPDYYDPLSAIPEISKRLRWVEDADGNVIDSSEEFLRVLPKGYFTSIESTLTKKMEANMRQMQETRKVCTKIGVVKQMQLQSQMYQNQFQKYNPEPFVEQDIAPHVISDNGPVMNSGICRATLQRSVAKIFYHAGFEEFQPSALDAVTDIAADLFTNLARSLGAYREAPEVAATLAIGVAETEGTTWGEKFTTEETILHCLGENGIDVEALESYVKDDVERLGTKLGVMHDRMKAHLADLLRPALNDAGPDGVNAFNDGSEQFVGGDFAEDLDEDFFGFKELGLDKEFGLASLSVPLHLLQNRLHNANQAQNPSAATTLISAFEPPPPFEPLTMQNLNNQIGLVRNFFLAKLHANNDEPLVEDDDLPQKQRFPKPRLPPTGKISSPRKRPIKEQGGGAKKKKKLEGGKEDEGKNGGGVLGMKPVGKLKLSLPGPALMERVESNKVSEPEKDDASGVGMMSPESIAAN
ncbi:MAG: Transcriptional activator spt7 [Pycnora praestabilis]|nr:MAG: Transcriptional activator spt7 [Pycnora praestabilis]